MAHRLACVWHPTPEDFARLLSAETANEAVVRAYPFPTDPTGAVAASAHNGLEVPLPESNRAGIRAQLIRRSGQTLYWTCEGNWIGGALVEIEDAARALPEGTVLDGLLVAWHEDGPLALPELRRELSRRDQGGRSHRKAAMVFLACDLWELGGIDWRGRPFGERRQALEEIMAGVVKAFGAVPRPAGASVWCRENCSRPTRRLPRSSAASGCVTFPAKDADRRLVVAQVMTPLGEGAGVTCN